MKKITNRDRKRIFTRAHYLLKEQPWNFSFLSEALKFTWTELKEYRAKKEEERKRKEWQLIWDARPTVQPTEDYKLELAFRNGATII